MRPHAGWLRVAGLSCLAGCVMAGCDSPGAQPAQATTPPDNTDAQFEDFAECRRAEEEAAATSWEETQTRFGKEDAAKRAAEQKAYTEWLEAAWQEQLAAEERYRDWLEENPPTVADRREDAIRFADRYVTARAAGSSVESALHQASAKCRPDICGAAFLMFSESPKDVQAHWHDAAERGLRHWSNATKTENDKKAQPDFVPWGGNYELVGGMSKVFMVGLGLDYRLVFHDMRELDAWRCVLEERRPDGEIDRVPECRERLSRKAATGQSRCTLE